MENLLKLIREREENIWLLYLDLQRLKMGDSRLFSKQDFSKLRDSCEQILSLIGE